MGMLSLFGWKTYSESTSSLPQIFTLGMSSDFFVDTDVTNVYSKILTDCTDRTEGIPEKVKPLLWDNVLQNECPDGLITRLAKAMTQKEDLFLVYEKAIMLLRKATPEEQIQIEEDYTANGQSDVGVFVSFENYTRTDMVKLYSGMEYCSVASLNKLMNLSKALQYKASNLRSSVSLSDSSIAIDQARAISAALGEGKDILIDKEDEFVTGTPDITAVKESLLFLDSKKCFYYAMPLSYVNGEQTAGIGSTGEADTKAVERGLRQYFTPILKPILDALFGLNVSFKSNDFRQIATSLQALKDFELVSEDLLTLESKRKIIAKMFDIDMKDMPEGEPQKVLIPPFPERTTTFNESANQPGD